MSQLVLQEMQGELGVRCIQPPCGEMRLAWYGHELSVAGTTGVGKGRRPRHRHPSCCSRAAPLSSTAEGAVHSRLEEGGGLVLLGCGNEAVWM